MKQTNTKDLVLLALFSAIILVLASTPIGYVPLGFMRATTIHIPVIIAAVLLGPKAGAFLGAVFGLTSLLNNTFNPTITSFVFTPFYNLSPEYGGNLWSLVICFVPRILIGVLAAYAFILLKKTKLPIVINLAVTGFIGSITNTIFVMGGIYLFFGESYAAAKDISVEALFTVIMGIVAVNGVMEAICAAVLAVAITLPLLQYLKRRA